MSCVTPQGEDSWKLMFASFWILPHVSSPFAAFVLSSSAIINLSLEYDWLYTESHESLQWITEPGHGLGHPQHRLSFSFLLHPISWSCRSLSPLSTAMAEAQPLCDVHCLLFHPWAATFFSTGPCSCSKFLAYALLLQEGMPYFFSFPLILTGPYALTNFFFLTYFLIRREFETWRGSWTFVLPSRKLRYREGRQVGSWVSRLEHDAGLATWVAICSLSLVLSYYGRIIVMPAFGTC